jgi:hypothetical protein
MNAIKLLILATFLFSTSPIFAQNETYFDGIDSLNSWMDQRMENAKKGIVEKVEMPFAVRTLGWGCMCPDSYIGVSPNVGEGPWVEPIAPNDFPTSDTLGYSLVVTGYFTGKIIEIDLRNEEGEPEEWLYKVPEFKVISWTENTKGYDIHPPRILKK